MVSVVVGCSFIGARVPAQPEPTHHCPMGVVAADGLGTAFFLIPPIACGLDGAIGGYSGEYDGVACFVFGVPMAVIGTVYLVSTIYGARANRRCERRKEAHVEEAQREQKTGAEIRVRAPVVGDAPMFCAITEPDVGQCFADETCGGVNPGGTCEPRQAAWCFDVTTIVGGPIATTCVVSAVDCDARRLGYTRDASLVVTTCGTYQQRVPAVVPTQAPL
jgi:hypothetical protein